jgi:hypothetical protein
MVKYLPAVIIATSLWSLWIFLVLVWHALGPQEDFRAGSPGPEPTVSEPPNKQNPRVRALQRMDRRLSRLARSNLAFNAPKQMRLGENETLKLTLSPSASVGELTQRLRESGATGKIVSEQQIVTAKRMQARLTGSEFEIEATSPETQAITFSQPTDWTWDVTPTEEGDSVLDLTVTALIHVEGETTPRQIRSFSKLVTVNVTVGQRISGFVGTNWQWLWTAILVPVGVWGWEKWKDRREQRSALTPPNE